MKTLLLSVFVTLFVGFASAQEVQVEKQNSLSSDDPSFYVPSGSKTIPSNNDCPSCAMMSLSVVDSVAPCDGGIDTLIATGGCGGYIWSTDALGANVISTSDTLITGMLTNDTTFYVGGVAADLDSLMPLPPHSSIFSGNVRGYYFTAPVDFVITGLRVPDDGITGAQNLEILRFDNQTPPPLFSVTTNAFQSLGYWNNYTGPDTISVCISVTAGDVIGIYGTRGNQNSYAGAPYQSMIGGIPVTLTRSGMQQQLSSNQMANVFSEAGGSISRVEMYYDITPSLSSIDPINVIVPQSYNLPIDATLCTGDSVLIGGVYRTTAGVYNDTTFSIYGCDSISEVTLSLTPVYDLLNEVNICDGDSILLEGAYQTSFGIYQDFLQTSNGCDSTVTTILNVSALPTVSFAGDTLCVQAGSVALAGGSPSGGTYTGANVTANSFDATSAGTGVYPVTYTYTDSLGCISDIMSDVSVVDCASIGENTLEGVSVYPNPVTTHVVVDLPENMSNATVTLFDAGGKMINLWNITNGSLTVNMESLSNGMYVLEVNAMNQIGKYKLIKK